MIHRINKFAIHSIVLPVSPTVPPANGCAMMKIERQFEPGDRVVEWTGGCLCGEIRYRVTADPEWVGYCHCQTCRKQSGAPVTACAMFPLDQVTWVQGKPAYYSASQKAKRGFCPACGGNLTWETPSSFTVFIGGLDRPEDLRPNSHSYTATQLPWLVIDDDLRRHPAHDDVQ